MAVGLCICLVAGLAAGDPPLAGDRAVELANQGLADYGAGKWEEAYESFRLADAPPGITVSSLLEAPKAGSRP